MFMVGGQRHGHKVKSCKDEVGQIGQRRHCDWDTIREWTTRKTVLAPFAKLRNIASIKAVVLRQNKSFTDTLQSPFS